MQEPRNGRSHACIPTTRFGMVSPECFNTHACSQWPWFPWASTYLVSNCTIKIHLLHHRSQVGKGRVVKVTGIQNKGPTATVLLRGSNKLVLGEADRSLHDALCVIRCLVQKRALIAGGSSPEMEINMQLLSWSKTLQVRELTLSLGPRILPGACMRAARVSA